MTEFLKYILESGIALVVFYLFYEVGLKRETCFAQNRVYLLLTPILAFLLPLFNLPIYLYTENPTNTVLELSPLQVISEQTLSSGMNWTQVVVYLYILGVALIFLKMGLDLRAFNKLLNTYKSQFIRVDNHYEVTSAEIPATFSFLSYIFWKKDDQLSQEDRDKIRTHELIHVKQKHTYDILYIRVLTAIFWFNPVIWLYKKALDNTHEYLADNSVIHRVDKYSYMQLLVRELFRDSGLDLARYFAKSRTSKRIEMMKLKSYVTDKGRFLLVIPLSLVMLVIFSFEMRQMDIAELHPVETNNELDITIYKEEGLSEKSIQIEDGEIAATIEDLKIEIKNIDTPLKTQKALELINTLNAQVNQGEQNTELPHFPGGSTAWNKFVQKNLRTSSANKTEGEVFIQFLVRKNGKIEDIKLVKGLNSYSNRESIRLIEASPLWIPGKVNGENTDIRIIVPVLFQAG